MKVAAYVRVSTVGQNESGQRAEIQKWLDGHGASEVLWFIDKASGKDLDRPEFKKLQQAVFSKEVDTVVCYKLDRLSRDIRDGVIMLCDLVDNGIRVVSVTQQLDFSGAVGKMVASVLFAVAQMERQNILERQQAGIRPYYERYRRFKELRDQGMKRGQIMDELGIDREMYEKLSRSSRGRPKGSRVFEIERAVELQQEGLTYKKIASTMGCAESTVCRLLQQAKELDADTTLQRMSG